MADQSALLEVICQHARDAQRAEQGGADRVELIGVRDDGGLSPEPEVVARVCETVGIAVRVMLRLRPGFGTDGSEVVRLRGLAASYREAGADGMVLGFLNGHSQIDRPVVEAIIADADWPWTFHRAIDHVLEPRRAWRTLLELPRLDQVLTAGSPRGVEYGLDDLITVARTDPRAASVIMAGGGLAAEHVPWLARAGVRAFHLGAAARPDRSWKAYVDADLVRSWRTLVDDSVTKLGVRA